MMKRTTDQYRQVDIRELPDYLFEPGNATTWCWYKASGLHKGEKVASIGITCEKRTRLWLEYSVSSGYGEESEDKKYPISVEWTPCNFGGQRPWWRCPGQGCGRRCAILYGGEVFVCRECRDLTYRRCQISGDAFEEARHKAQKLADRYNDGSLEFSDPSLWSLGSKPKGMHWDTWRDVLEEFEEAKEKASEAMRSELRELVGSLD